MATLKEATPAFFDAMHLYFLAAQNGSPKRVLCHRCPTRWGGVVGEVTECRNTHICINLVNKIIIIIINRHNVATLAVIIGMYGPRGQPIPQRCVVGLTRRTPKTTTVGCFAPASIPWFGPHQQAGSVLPVTEPLYCTSERGLHVHTVHSGDGERPGGLCFALPAGLWYRSPGEVMTHYFMRLQQGCFFVNKFFFCEQWGPLQDSSWQEGHFRVWGGYCYCTPPPGAEGTAAPKTPFQGQILALSTKLGIQNRTACLPRAGTSLHKAPYPPWLFIESLILWGQLLPADPHKANLGRISSSILFPQFH